MEWHTSKETHHTVEVWPCSVSVHSQSSPSSSHNLMVSSKLADISWSRVGWNMTNFTSWLCARARGGREKRGAGNGGLKPCIACARGRQ